jgi:Zn ribbon nucleic-acid-binding protein
MQVDSHIAGSRCVIYKNKNHYIDVRTHSTNFEVAECVKQGHVYKTVSIYLKDDAPYQVIKLVKEELI